MLRSCHDHDNFTVVYDSHRYSECPVCSRVDMAETLEQYYERQERIKGLEQTVRSLRKKIEDLEAALGGTISVAAVNDERARAERIQARGYTTMSDRRE